MRRAFIGVVAVGAVTWGGVGVASPAGQPERAAALRLTATADAIIMPGTKIGYIPSQDEFTAYATAVIGATAGAPGAVDYLGVPGEFWPATGLDSLTFDASVAAGQAMLTPMVDGAIESDTPIVVFGHSQSAVIATKEKQRLLAEYPDPDTAPDVTFVMVANPNRPNGGLLARFPGLYIPILGVTFNGATPAPADGPFDSYDVAREFDGWADFPRYPLNLVATANAILGIYYLHGGYYELLTENPDILDDPERTIVQQYGDTTYYLIRTEQLPLLRPLRDLGVPEEFVDALEPYVRRIVDLGYDRNTPYGEPAPVRVLPPLTPAPGPATQHNAGQGITVASATSTPDKRTPVVEAPVVEAPVEEPPVQTGRSTLKREKPVSARHLVRNSLRAVPGLRRGEPAATPTPDVTPDVTPDAPAGQPEPAEPNESAAPPAAAEADDASE